MNVGSFFSGAALLDFGLTLAGFEHIWFCEADEFRRSLIERRYPGVPVHPDIRAFPVDAVRCPDLIAGGFPCRGASTAGRREGMGHAETVLWRQMARAIRVLRPRFVLVEQVANALAMRPAGGEPGDIWTEVVGDLAACGYSVEWECIPAAAVGAPHGRDRVFALAHADGEGGTAGRRRQYEGCGEFGTRRRDHVGAGVGAVADTERRVHGRAGQGDLRGAEGTGAGQAPQRQRLRIDSADGDDPVAVEWGAYEPAIRRWEAIHGPAPAPLTRVRGLDDGDAKLRRLRARVDRSRLSALGDGVQVQVAQLVGERVMELAA